MDGIEKPKFSLAAGRDKIKVTPSPPKPSDIEFTISHTKEESILPEREDIHD